MRRFGSVTTLIICSILCLGMPGCNSAQESADAETAGEAEAEKPHDAYDDYIRNAIATVDGNRAGDTSAGNASQEAKDTQPSRTVSVDRTAPSDFYISSMENKDAIPDPYVFNPSDGDITPVPTDDTSASPSPTTDPSGTPTPTPTPYITPDEFETDTCCIYINGESDSAFGTEVVTAINKVRKDLGYKEFVKNKGLSDCADRRTREIAANYSHTRPNGKPFYSVAPEHFKAEMLIINNQKAEDTVDTLIKRDSISRDLIFSNKYQSIGASSFKCNGMKYTVVSFGL